MIGHIVVAQPQRLLAQCHRRSASINIPPPLVGGGWGRGLAPAGAHDSGNLTADDGGLIGALPRANPSPSPPPTRGGGMYRVAGIGRWSEVSGLNRLHVPAGRGL